MPEEQITVIIRELAKAIDLGDVEKALACFSDDAAWVLPDGTFKGKEAIKRYLTAMTRNIKDIKGIETGNGIIVHGDKAFFEYILSGMSQGKKCEFLGMDAYEFKNDKIKNIRTVYDRLLIAQQVAPWLARPLVNMIVRQSEKAMK